MKIARRTLFDCLRLPLAAPNVAAIPIEDEPLELGPTPVRGLLLRYRKSEIAYWLNDMQLHFIHLSRRINPAYIGVDRLSGDEMRERYDSGGVQRSMAPARITENIEGYFEMAMLLIDKANVA